MLDLSQFRICVPGGNGFLGRHVCDVLRARGVENISVPRSANYYLTTEFGAWSMYQDFKPDIVIHLAADVGGIQKNQQHPGRFFYRNLMMGMNVIEQARLHDVRKIVVVSTVCAYPRNAPLPFSENDLWNGYPEKTNAPYGVAKRALGVMLDAYAREYGLKSAYLLLANLYGPGDDFIPATSHVVPGMIVRLGDAALAGAESVHLWGTGGAGREFLYVTDAAEAVVRAAERIDNPAPINIGIGRETLISELAALIAPLVGWQGEIKWDSSMPDGQPMRRLDVSRALELLNWKADVELHDGLRRTVEWYYQQCGLPLPHSTIG